MATTTDVILDDQRLSLEQARTVDPTYELVRTLVSPIVAITSTRNGEPNGMIANSAARASLSVTKPRLSVYIHKFNYSHDTIFSSGKFNVHLLHSEQMETVYALGFASRRDGDKMDSVDFHLGANGVPILDDHFAVFECEVINVMDTGSSTLFLGSITQATRGPGRQLLAASELRERMSPDRREAYVANLEEAQQHATQLGEQMKVLVWPGLLA